MVIGDVINVNVKIYDKKEKIKIVVDGIKDKGLHVDFNFTYNGEVYNSWVYAGKKDWLKMSFELEIKRLIEGNYWEK